MKFYRTYGASGMQAEGFRGLISRLAESLPEMMERCGADSIIVRGTSGYSVAYALRMVCDIPTVIARKASENSHAGQITGFGECSASKVLFVDDLVCSGETVRKLSDDAKELGLHIVGICLYAEYWRGYEEPGDPEFIQDTMRIGAIEGGPLPRFNLRPLPDADTCKVAVL